MLCIVEFAERASYYGVQTIFANFMQFPLPPGGSGSGAVPNTAEGREETAGALGKGLQFSVALGLLFSFLAYTIPIPAAYLADVYTGRYKMILIGVLICGVAHIIMICGAIPSVLIAGHGIAPFMISLFLLAIGAGAFKPNVAPTVLDQYQHQKPYIRVLKSGERVVVDPETTIQTIMLIFYALINVGAFFAIATTYSEKYVGYWLAFLLPGIVYFLLPALLWYLNNKLIKYPPNGSVLTKVPGIILLALRRNKFVVWKKNFWEAAKPSELAKDGITSFRNKQITWTDKDVDDVARTLTACMVFLYFPIYNCNDGGIGSVSSSQGSTMTSHGAPNDLLNNFNPLTIIVAVPILSYVVYPTLRRFNIKFGRISRITLGFSIASVSGVIAAIVQWRIYETSPCGYYATACGSDGEVSPISIWWQLPNYALGALSECFCNVTAYELAYARSPPGMKSLVMAAFLFNQALSYALGEILTPAIADPHLIWIWAGPAIALAVQTVIFWIRYRKLNDDEFMTYESDARYQANERDAPLEGVAVPETTTEKEPKKSG
ncbi:hypothetical protein BAUCODRAFT_120266 [Baudoinia panamericana UAMH 10762]|uniref:Major facilitator superfamily (MFS) profile domain-containing protein n=1 Tax=Baudoinia panamericana (strain UAMH 10762) TaxID=717646 RepID=M2MQC1_BAUPA|nr:uncharacterized protein BAUCODRAFT_120266 [Baudoinia panamericana UAMH 10762]EMC98976.1 hypothetical protein BAUCODRAFT_120266 [Baudoinia panamericana UAMH 10762]